MILVLCVDVWHWRYVDDLLPGGELPLLGRRARTRRAEAHRPQGDVRIEAAFEWMKQVLDDERWG